MNVVKSSACILTHPASLFACSFNAAMSTMTAMRLSLDSNMRALCSTPASHWTYGTTHTPLSSVWIHAPNIAHALTACGTPPAAGEQCQMLQGSSDCTGPALCASKLPEAG